MSRHANPEGHMSSELLAAYISRRLAEPERGSVERHLSECASCRRELVAAQDLLARRRRPRLIGSAAAVTAIAATVLLLARTTTAPISDDAPRVGTPLLRSGDSVAALGIVDPPDGGTVAGETLILRWRSAGPDRIYRVHILTESGDRIWSSETPDTTATPPSGTPLRSGRSYLWYVDAISLNGDSTSSGPRGFVVR